MSLEIDKMDDTRKNTVKKATLEFSIFLINKKITKKLIKIPNNEGNL